MRWTRTALITAMLAAAAGATDLAAGAAARADADGCTDAGSTGAVLRDTTTDLRLMLNVPAYRLDVVERGMVSRSIPVSVGQPKYRTPLGHFRIEYVVWNPWWRPPDSPWARKERVTPPGWQNPVGRVKLHVTGLVFLHGSPLVSSLGSAGSHACVRMTNDDAIALARLIHDHAGPPMATGTLDSLVADTSLTRTVVLSRAVPVDIDYRLAEVLGDDLVLYRDIYRYAGRSQPPLLDQAVQALLQARGDTAGIDLRRLRALVRAARRATVQGKVEGLFKVQSGAGEASGQDLTYSVLGTRYGVRR